LTGVLPQTSVDAFGRELLVLGLIDLTAVTTIVVRGRRAAADRPRREYLVRVVMAAVAVIPTVIAGALLSAHHPGGLWWQGAGTGLCIAAGVLDAWVLLVEILR
jgi:hypothetical protein